MTISGNDKNRQTGSDLNNQDLPLGKTENGNSEKLKRGKENAKRRSVIGN
jgi:hypothetical protein